MLFSLRFVPYIWNGRVFHASENVIVSNKKTYFDGYEAQMSMVHIFSMVSLPRIGKTWTLPPPHDNVLKTHLYVFYSLIWAMLFGFDN